MFAELQSTIEKVLGQDVPDTRKVILQPLIDYLQNKIGSQIVPALNFICTHNSRRSQFSQIWAQTAADYFNIPAHCFSGGVEVTAFNERAVASMKRGGFNVLKHGDGNPVYTIYHTENSSPITAFSKLYDDPANKADTFAAVMTCSHADENCPYIQGAEERIAVRYEDPKKYDDTDLETTMYDERSMQIASEMFYVFSMIKKD